MRIAYTDGSGTVSGEPGGWAWVEMDERDGWLRARAGYAADATNQRMEMTAAWMAMDDLEGDLLIVSDSAYVVNCFHDRWYERWLDNDWRNGRGKRVANRDLWEPMLDTYLRRRLSGIDTQFLHVRGHKGDRGNEMADLLCGLARKERWAGTLESEALDRVEREGSRWRVTG